MLPKDEPAELKFNGIPVFEYTYPVLPSSVITRFIVRMNQKRLICKECALFRKTLENVSYARSRRSLAPNLQHAHSLHMSPRRLTMALSGARA